MLRSVYNFFYVFVAIIIKVNCINHNVVETLFEWKRLQFDYPSPEARQEDIDKGIYIPDVPVLLDVQPYYDRHNKLFVFVTIPKIRPGVPITVGYITDKKIDGDPVIAPFPSWEWHRNTSECNNKFVSVYHLEVDRCGLIYVLDSGNEGNGVICPPKLVLFNLKHYPGSRYIVHYYEFPSRVYKSDSVFVNFAIQVLGINCDLQAFAYVADAAKNNLVYAVINDGNSPATRTITHSSMKPNDEFSQFDILGDKFVLRIGIFIIRLVPGVHPFELFLNLQYLAMSSGYWNYMDIVTIHRGLPLKVNTYPSPLTSQVGAMISSKSGVMIFGNMFNTSILCTNTRTVDVRKYSYTLYKNATTMQFPSTMKVVNNREGREQLWIMTNRFQKALTTGYNFNEINFRILVAWVKELTKDSPCLKPK